MNKFYDLPKPLQWLIAIVLFAMGMAIMLLWAEIKEQSSWYYLLLFLIVPVFQFLGAPLFTLFGLYRYYSPMLLAYAPSPKKLDLHLGTSFDYFMIMKGTKPGPSWRNKILEHYLGGLLKIINEIENGNIPETVKVSGSSYFFSEQSVMKLGFKIKKAGFFVKLNLLFNIVDLIWTYSLAYAKLSFPDLRDIKKAEAEGRDLVLNKDKIERLYNGLKVRNAR